MQGCPCSRSLSSTHWQTSARADKQSTKEQRAGTVGPRVPHVAFASMHVNGGGLSQRPCVLGTAPAPPLCRSSPCCRWCRTCARPCAPHPRPTDHDSTHLHAAWLRLLHFDAYIDLGRVHEVLLGLDVDVVQQAACVYVVHRVVAVVNVVVLALLRVTSTHARGGRLAWSSRGGGWHHRCRRASTARAHMPAHATHPTRADACMHAHLEACRLDDALRRHNFAFAVHDLVVAVVAGQPRLGVPAGTSAGGRRGVGRARWADNAIPHTQKPSRYLAQLRMWRVAPRKGPWQQLTARASSSSPPPTHAHAHARSYTPAHNLQTLPPSFPQPKPSSASRVSA